MAEDSGLLVVLNNLLTRIEKMEGGQKRFAKKMNREQRALKERFEVEASGDGKTASKAAASRGAEQADTARTPKSEKKARREAEARALENVTSKLLEQLPPEARSKFEQEQQGRSAADRAIAAMTLHGSSQATSTTSTGQATSTSSATANAAAPESTASSGTGARGPGPATAPSVRYPGSFAEFYSMPKDQRERLINDDSFDLEKLPGERRK